MMQTPWQTLFAILATTIFAQAYAERIRTAKEAHDLLHARFFELSAEGDDFTSMESLYASDVVTDWSTYVPWFPHMKSVYKGRDQVNTIAQDIKKGIIKFADLKFTYDFGEGTPEAVIVTHHVTGGIFSGQPNTIRNYKSYCSCRVNDAGLISHVQYSLIKEEPPSAKASHNLVHQIWAKLMAEGSNDFTSVAAVYAPDVVVDWSAMVQFFPHMKNTYKGRDQINPFMQAVAKGILKMEDFKWTYDFGDGTQRACIATHHVTGFMGKDGVLQNLKQYCTFKLNDAGLVSHVGYSVVEIDIIRDKEDL